MPLSQSPLPMMSDAMLLKHRRRAAKGLDPFILTETLDYHARLWSGHLQQPISFEHNYNPAGQQLKSILRMGAVELPVWMDRYVLGTAIDHPQQLLEKIGRLVSELHADLEGTIERLGAARATLLRDMPKRLPEVANWTVALLDAFMTGDPGSGRDRPIAVRFETLDSGLRSKIECVFVRDERELEACLKEIGTEQVRRWHALEARRDHPGRIAADPFAAVLLRALRASLDTLAALQDGERFEPHRSVVIDGLTIECMFFKLVDGCIEVHFNCEVCRYLCGELELHSDIPLTMLESLPGRPLSDLVAGSLFDEVEATIVDVANEDGRTSIILQWRPTWVVLDNASKGAPRPSDGVLAAQT